MGIRVEELLPEVRESISENLGLTGDELREKLLSFSCHDALDAYLTWHGIINYTTQITRAMKSIQGAETNASSHQHGSNKPTAPERIGLA